MFDDTEEMTSKTLGERLNRSLTLLSVYQPFLRSELWKTWATALAATATDRRFPGTSVQPRKVRTNTRPASRPRLMKDNPISPDVT